MIEGDISQCFPSIDHLKLVSLIEKRILDRQFTKLIWKSLRAGYFELKVYSNSLVGTPQGSIISPILSNIFMHQLDEHVASLKKAFDVGSGTRPLKATRDISYRIHKAKKEGDKESLAF